MLEYWHHHQTVLSGDGQPDFLAQVRRVRANTSTASSRQGFVWGMGHVSDTQTGLIYMRARYYDPRVGRFILVGKTYFSPVILSLTRK